MCLSGGRDYQVLAPIQLCQDNNRLSLPSISPQFPFQLNLDESHAANVPTTHATTVNATTANVVSDTHGARRKSTEIASERQL